MSTELEQAEWPKRNPLIEGKKWKMANIGIVTSFNTTKQSPTAPWMVEFMVERTMNHDTMTVDDFLDNATPQFNWFGASREDETK